MRSGGERTPGRLAFKTEKLEKQRRAWEKENEGEQPQGRSGPRVDATERSGRREAGSQQERWWGWRPVLWAGESVKVRTWRRNVSTSSGEAGEEEECGDRW